MEFNIVKEPILSKPNAIKESNKLYQYLCKTYGNYILYFLIINNSNHYNKTYPHHHYQ
ncbi:MAG: hypothetical protein K0S41_4139 [Anaerocolumna sp.]|nr:hypothetical protein [Anaerocolumna sp.]